MPGLKDKMDRIASELPLGGIKTHRSSPGACYEAKVAPFRCTGIRTEGPLGGYVSQGSHRNPGHGHKPLCNLTQNEIRDGHLR